MAIRQWEELRDRIEARRKDLEARLAEARADTRKTGRTVVEELEGRLHELGEFLEDGWDELSESVAARLNRWLDRSDT